MPTKKNEIKETKKERTFNFGDKKFPYVDAVDDFTFQIKEKHIRAAKQQDPNCCVGACAVRDITQGVFYRDVAVLLVVDRKGRTVANRYRFTGKFRKLVRDFDDGKGFTAGTYLLKAPSPSFRLDYRKEIPKLVPKSKRKVRPQRGTPFMGRATTPAQFS